MPDAWHDVQHEIIKYMNVCGSQLASVDHSRNNEFWSSSTMDGLDQMMMQVGPSCEPVMYAAANPHWRAFSDYDYIDEAGIDRSAFYRLNADYGIRYRMGIRLIDHHSISRALVIFWNGKHGHADQKDFEKINRIVEPLRLSAHISLAMGQDMSPEQLLIDNLERSSSAAMVLDASSEILLSNSLVEPIFHDRDGLGIHRKRLLLQDRNSQERLNKLSSQIEISSHTGQFTGGGIIAVPRPSGLPSYIVMVSPLPKREQFMGKAKKLALVIVHDPAKATQVDRRIYIEGLGLTAAEADVAAWFLQGATLEEISKRRGVSLHTVRRQLKEILRKTGTHRQAELVALLAPMSKFHT